MTHEHVEKVNLLPDQLEDDAAIHAYFCVVCGCVEITQGLDCVVVPSDLWPRFIDEATRIAENGARILEFQQYRERVG